MRTHLLACPSNRNLPPSHLHTAGEASASQPPKHDKKAGKHGSKKGGSGGGWLAGSLQPVPRDVAIVGLVLVFAGMRCAGRVAEVCW